jgi:hypothetical protein
MANVICKSWVTVRGEPEMGYIFKKKKSFHFVVSIKQNPL